MRYFSVSHLSVLTARDQIAMEQYLRPERLADTVIIDR
jgi:hypothetical protein